jgi:hypothetical protein
VLNSILNRDFYITDVPPRIWYLALRIRFCLIREKKTSKLKFPLVNRILQNRFPMV